MAPGVAVRARVRSSPGRGPEAFQGILELDEVALGFDVGGRVARISVQEGDTVAAEAPIAALDDGLARLALAARKAEAAAAGATLALLRAGTRPEDVGAASAEIVAGKIAPYVVIGYVQITLVLVAGKLVFRVPLVGSLALLYLVSFAFIAANLALGLLFSTVARTQQQAMQMSFFFLLPNILLSGFAFPWEGMPTPARLVSLGLPLTHFLRVVRGITLKGSTFADVAPELTWLGGQLVVLFAAAALRFKKKLI